MRSPHYKTDQINAVTSESSLVFAATKINIWVKSAVKISQTFIPLVWHIWTQILIVALLIVSSRRVKSKLDYLKETDYLKERQVIDIN
jgi:hypothetical protein